MRGAVINGRPEDRAASAETGPTAGSGRPHLVLVVALLVLLGVLLVQVGTAYYLLGDSDYYLRDAFAFAGGEIPRSRYSPGFALFLAPIAAASGGSVELAWDASLIVNAFIGVAAFWLVYLFLRPHVGAWAAVAAAAVAVLGQGPVVYFAHVRPEALALLLVTGGLLALRRDRPVWAVVLLAAATLVRVALGPFALVLWAGWLRRDWRVALAGGLLAVLAVAGHLATEPVVDPGYTQIGAAAYDDVDASAAGTALTRTVAGGMLTYGRYGVPRFVWPQTVLSSPIGPIVAAATLGLLALGALALWRGHGDGGGTRDRAVLRAGMVAALAYGLVLLAWPMRDLAAVRLLLPVAALVLVCLAAGLRRILAHLAAGRARVAATATLLLLLALAVASTGNLVWERHRGPTAGRDFAAAHLEVRDELPAGAVLSSNPAASELLIGQPVFELPLRADQLDPLVDELRACTVVLQRKDQAADELQAWIDRHEGGQLATSGSVRIVSIDREWCPRT